MQVFDDGDFSGSDAVLLSDSMAHIPREVLSKNFGVAEEAFKDLPRNELFIFQTEVPAHWRPTRTQPQEHLGSSDFAFRTMEMPPTKRTKDGEVRIVDSSKFKVSTATIRTFRSRSGWPIRRRNWSWRTCASIGRR
jgi:oxalate decarboxylase